MITEIALLVQTGIALYFALRCRKAERHAKRVSGSLIGLVIRGDVTPSQAYNAREAARAAEKDPDTNVREVLGIA